MTIFTNIIFSICMLITIVIYVHIIYKLKYLSILVITVLTMSLLESIIYDIGYLLALI